MTGGHGGFGAVWSIVQQRIQSNTFSAASETPSETTAPDGSDLAQVRAMIAFYENDNARAGRGAGTQTFEITGQDRTLADTAEPLPKLIERMRIEGLSEGTAPRTVSILGENIGTLRDGLFTDHIKLHNGANAMTVVHERLDGETKRALAEGRRSRDWFLSEVRQAEAAMGETLLTTGSDGRVSDQSLIEAVTKLGEAYFAGRLQDQRLPTGLHAFFREMVHYFKELFRRAGRLRRAIAQGRISGDFTNHLADSLGLPLDSDTVRAQRQADTAAEDLEFERTFAIDKQLKIVEASTNAPRSAEQAREYWKANGPAELTLPSGKRVAVTMPGIKKIIAGSKPHPQARMALVAHLQELVAEGHEVHRRDDGRDPQVEQVSEIYAAFRFQGEIYRARILAKLFKPESGKDDKLHSARIEGLDLEKADARLEKFTGGADPSSVVPSVTSPGAVISVYDLVRGSRTHLPKAADQNDTTFSLRLNEKDRTMQSALRNNTPTNGPDVAHEAPASPTGSPAGDPDAARFGLASKSVNEETRLVESSFKKLGIEIIKVVGDKPRVHFDGEGNLYLDLPEQHLVSNELWSIAAGLRSGIASRLLLGEELVHGAHFYNLRESWLQSGARGSFNRYVTEFHQKMFEDLRNTIEAAGSKTSNEYKALAGAVRAAYHAYYTSPHDAPLTKVNLTTVLAEIENDSARKKSEFMFEFLRQVVQLKKQGALAESISEKIFKFLTKEFSWIGGALETLRKMLPGAYEGKFGKIVQRSVMDIETTLAELSDATPQPVSIDYQNTR